MCGSKQSVDVIEPSRTPRSSRSPRSASAAGDLPSTSSANTLPHSRTFTNTGGSTTSYSSSLSSSTTLSGIRASLPENPNIYDFSEISAATGGFLMSRFSSSSSSSSWRCSLRGRDAIVFQRKLRRQIDPPEIQQKLSTICRIHHSSLIKLLGASLSGNYIYLAYEFVHGVNLADCLRNSKNPSFTVLSTWLSRMQIATDVAHGLDYVHHCSGLKSEFVHNHINSSSIVVADGSLNAKICHFGTSELCGETDSETASDAAESEPSGEIKSESSTSGSKKSLRRSRSRAVKVEGTRGYMSPEFLTTGLPTQKCDVYAFGVVILELLSGVEPLKYRLDEGSGGGYQRVSVIETARGALEGGELRTWIDRRLKDSYPVDVAERIIRVGLDCVEDDPDKRPDMGRVAVLVSKLYLESKNWSEMLTLPTDFSVSLAPR